MVIMKRMIMTAAMTAVALFMFSSEAANVVVSELQVRQRFPWNGLVDIDVTVECTDVPNVDIKLFVTSEDVIVKTVYLASDTTKKAPLKVKSGRHHIVWDAQKDVPNCLGSIGITVSAVDDAEYYMVVDLSGGPSASSYPVQFYREERFDNWTDAFKTGLWVFRLIDPGVFRMGCETTEKGYSGREAVPHEVAITKPFFMSIFETTQRQWELVTGSRPSTFNNSSYYATRPVETVSYSMIRGNGDWPLDDSVSADSFVGKLRAKTGRSGFDLPTSAQWEYACRAGTTTALNNGKNLSKTDVDANLDKIARYYKKSMYTIKDGKVQLNANAGTDVCTAKVGSFLPNSWGLYDMHGNVREWTLDWFWGREQLSVPTGSDEIDPLGESWGLGLRTVYGGDFLSAASNCRSSDRNGDVFSSLSYKNGFRLACDAPGFIPALSVNLSIDTCGNPLYTGGVSGGVAVFPFGTRWDGSSAVAVMVGETALTNAAGVVNGEIIWYGEKVEPGWHKLRHVTNKTAMESDCLVFGDDAMLHQGVVTVNETWTSDKIHVIKWPITLKSGATLTIEPGAVVKFCPGMYVEVEDGGKLNAAGSVARPIVFTSLSDDAHGGDTNRDGPSFGAAGDWNYLWIGGTAVFEHCELLYGGTTNENERGIVMTYGSGSLTMDGCIVAHSGHDGVFNWGGNISIYNSIFTDLGWATAPYRGDNQFVNCVFDGCEYALAYWTSTGWSGRPRYVNCIFSNPINDWANVDNADYTALNRDCSFSHCLFSGQDSSGLPDAMKTGKNGNVLGDPLFADLGNEDLWRAYSVSDGSPCIDAGDGTVALEFDAFWRPRMNVPGVTPVGVADSRGLYPDIGVFEAPGVGGPGADLAVTHVEAPQKLVSGEKATVTWTVENVGIALAFGEWYDVVEIETASGQVIEMGRHLVSGTRIPVGSSQTFTAEFTVPCGREGECRVRVVSNKDRALYENGEADNNRCEANEPSTLALGPLVLPEDGSELELPLATGDEAGYLFPYSNSSSMILAVRADGDFAAWASEGVMTTRDTASSLAYEVIDGVWFLSVPTNGTGRVAFANDGTSDLVGNITLLQGDFFLYGGSKTKVGAGRRASVPFAGNGFTEDMECWLTKGSLRIDADDLSVASAMRATAVFNLSGCELGDYVLHIRKDGLEKSAECVELVEATGGADWFCNVNVAATVRAGRVYSGVLRFGNAGGEEMDAPYVSITAEQGTYIRLSESDAWTDSIQLLATSGTYPASVLKPGDEQSVVFFYKTSGESADLTYSYTLASAEAFPWSDAAAAMRPSWATDELWGFALGTLQDRFGATWNTYLDRLRLDADYLMKIGTPTKRLDRILQLEVNEALGADHAVQTLASATDLSRSGRGLGLTLSRTYSAAMSSRMRKGVFGYGWTDNFSMSAELKDDKTLVFNLPSGGSYLFTKVSGEWKPQDARDKTEVKETSSAYILYYPSGTVQTFSKSNMRTASVMDNQGHGLTFSYSGDLLKKITHTDGQYIEFTHANGRVSSVSDDQGRTVSYSYSGELLSSVTAFNGLVTRYEYIASSGSPSNLALAKIVYPDGSFKSFSYDAKGLVAGSSVNDALATNIERGELGSYAIIAPNGGRTVVVIGAWGETLKTVNALGQTVEQVYTQDSLLESTISPSGRRNKVVYDNNGTPISSMSASGTTTTFAYTSEFDNLASVTDAKGHSFEYSYDDYGRGTGVAYADGTSSACSYNSAKGDLVTSVNRRGQTITYEYDAQGNLAKTIWPDGRTFTLTRDERGNITKASDSLTGDVTMQYDPNDRLTRIVHPKNRGFEYTYDAAGRIASRTTLDGSLAQKYVYDSFGRLVRLTDASNVAYLENTYDETTGQLVRQTFGNGTSTEYQYDLLGRTVSIVHKKGTTVLEAIAYTYDEDGRRTSQTTNEGVERYAYDADGQLTAVSYPDGTSEDFAYDAVGNRTSANGTDYTVNALNQYTAIGTGTCTYDADGNLTRTVDGRGTTDYYYDVQNRLVGVTNTAANIRWSCVYDVFGNRTRVDSNGTVTEKLYVQGDLSSVAAEYDGAGNVKKRHILSGSVRIADLGASASETRYYHTDGLSSTRLLTDASGAVKGTASYKAFGETRVSSGETTDAGYVGSLGVETDPTGLLFMRNRYYSTGMGRFVQMDPIGVGGDDVNLYRYCNGDVVNNIDLTGFEQVNWACTISRAIGDTGNVLTLASAGGLPVAIAAAPETGGLSLVADAAGYISGVTFSFASGGLKEMFCGEKYTNKQASRDVWGAVFPPLGVFYAAEDLGVFNRINELGADMRKLTDDLVMDKLLRTKTETVSASSVSSDDPNEIAGIEGVGAKRWVENGEWLDYTIYFENKETASAAANDVYIDLPMDEGCDWSTLELGEIAFGEYVDTGLVGKRNGTSLFAYPGSNTFVKTTVTIKNGVLKWRIRDWVNETSDNYPEDPVIGFLPPNNKETHCGEGHVTYRVKIAADTPRGTRINASAQIVFDQNPMIETDPSWFNTAGAAPVGAEFSESEIVVNEGDDAVICIAGSGGEKGLGFATVYLTYNTAASADLDLGKALWTDTAGYSFAAKKFPLALTWGVGESGENVLVIPTKSDKAIEGDETFTLQLANPQRQGLGDVRVCTVTIHDPGYDDLAAKIKAGTASKAEQTAWDKLQKAKAPYIRGLADSAERGKVSGSGLCVAGKKVTLKATANKGFVFAGWTTEQIPLDGDRLVVGAQEYVATTPSLVIDRTAKPAKSTATSTTITGVDEDATYYACFITSAEDKAAMVASVDGQGLDPWVSKAETHAFATNVWAGVYLEWPVAASALSAPTVKVSGLPSGLKFAAKPVTSKIGTGKNAITVTNVPANTIYGAPTAASKSKTDKKTGVTTVTPSAVKVTVTTAGKSSQTYQIDTVVDALPAWAVGTYSGGFIETALPGGQVSLTIDAKGKSSGKALGDGLTYTLAAPYYAGFEVVDGGVGLVSNFLADVTASWSYKEGSKTIKTNDVVRMAVQDNGIGGYAAVEGWFEAYTVNWKVDPWKTLGKSFDKKVQVYAIRADGTFIDGDDAATVALDADVTGRVTLKFAASGTVAVSGEFAIYDEKKGKYTTVKAIGSATLVPIGDERGAVFIYLTPKGLSPHARSLDMEWPKD